MVKHRLYKPDIYGEDSRRAVQYTLHRTLKTILKLMSPVIPHVCDEMGSELSVGDHALFCGCYVSVSKWPSVENYLIDPNAEELGEFAKEIVGEIRKYKSEQGISLGAEMDTVGISVNPDLEEKIEKIKEDVMGTGKIGKLEISVLGADSGDGSKRFEMKF